MIVWSGLLVDDLRIQALGKVKQDGLKFGCPNVLCDTRTLDFLRFFFFSTLDVSGVQHMYSFQYIILIKANK
jgi:hypothetical protein